MIKQSLSESSQDAIDLGVEASEVGGSGHGGESEGLTKQQRKRKRKVKNKRRRLKEEQLASERG